MPASRLALSTLILLLASGTVSVGPIADPSRPAFAQPPTAARTMPTRALLERFGLERMWFAQAEMNPTRDTVRHLVADEQVVLVQSTGGLMTCFDAETGRRTWAVQVGRRDTPSFAPAANNELVLIAAGARLYAFDKWNGDPVWSIVVPGEPSASPAVDETQVYVGCMDGSLYAFNLNRIRELYEQDLLPQWSHLTHVWRHKTSGHISAPPVPTGSTVKFASHNRSLYSITRDQHNLRFQLETGAAVSAPLAYRPGTIYLASEDFKLYAVNSDNGRLRWEPYVTGTPISKAAHPIGDVIYLFPDRGGLHAVSVEDGQQLWWRPHPADFVAASRDRLYVSDEAGHLIVMDRRDGAPLGVLPLRSFPVRFANDRTDRLYLATPSGLVMALREQQLQFPIYHLFPEHRPILPEFAPETPEPPAAGQPPANP